MSNESISGYTYGTEEAAKSPLSLDDLEKLKKSVLFSDEDERYLKMAGDVLEDQIDDILDLWYNFVASNEHLVYYFKDGEGNPIEEYLNAVRPRFGKWILDTCRRSYDQEWLDYQQEIALRHHRTKKNKTDGVDSVPIINLRYIIAFIYPITATIKQFLENGEHGPEDIENMHQAWFKAVTLQATIWSHPYVKEGDF